MTFQEHVLYVNILIRSSEQIKCKDKGILVVWGFTWRISPNRLLIHESESAILFDCQLEPASVKEMDSGLEYRCMSQAAYAVA